MDTVAIQSEIDLFWDEAIIPSLIEFMRIPNQSPAFDEAWLENGHMQRAVGLVERWVKKHAPQGLKCEVIQDGTHTPLLLLEMMGKGKGEILLYGHLDKQPPMTGWQEGYGPWQPILEADGRLYGRGGADDGYAVYAAVALLRMLQSLKQQHGRIVTLIECSEESGSPDLPYYLHTYAEKIGAPELVICLDSGCGDYDRLWTTTSLRGLLGVTLRVEILDEGVHSGIAGGIVPNPMLVMRQLLDRLEDASTGDIKLAALHTTIPPKRIEEAKRTAQVLGGSVSASLPFVKGARPLSDSPQEMLLASTWRPALAVIGADGLPSTDQSGNVLLPSLTYRLSFRLPPNVSPVIAMAAIEQTLQNDPPFGASITLAGGGDPGWEAPLAAPWLEKAVQQASQEFFQNDSCAMGIGGSIPFMYMIGRKWPKAQFLITGVLGPHSNAHGPNEFLHTPYAKRLNASLIRIVQAYTRAV